MKEITLVNNEFLRQFEVNVEDSLARIEYSEQERKIFLTKLVIPEIIDNK
ncbi:MAG: N-acetyltransferase, partial [Flavobacteriaceae bacterium]